MKGRRVLQYLRIPAYDLEGLKKHLGEQAKKGFLLKKLGVIAVFERGEPKTREYVFVQKEKASDRMEESDRAWYRSRGLEFVCEYQREFYVFYQTLPKNSEIGIDPQMLVINHMKIEKQLICSAMIYVLGIVLYSSIIVKKGVQFCYISCMRDWIVPVLLLGLLIMLAGIISTIQEIRLIKMIQKQQPYEEQNQTKSVKTKKNLLPGSYLQGKLFCVMLIIIGLYSICLQSSWTQHPISEQAYQTMQLPLTLNQIEDNEENPWYEEAIDEQFNIRMNDQMIEYGWLGKTITIRENGYYTNKSIETTNQCVLTTYRYQMNVPWLQNGLLDCVIEETYAKYGLVTDEVFMTAWDGIKGMKEEYYAQKGNLKFLFLRDQENTCYAFIYSGRQSLLELDVR